jgi:hypothetical protein
MKDLKEKLKRVKLRTLIMLVMLLMFNVYAWFVFQTKVTGEVTARISAWEINFQDASAQNITDIVFEADMIFPGMEPVKQEITVENLGELPAIITYLIHEVTILGETKSVKDSGITHEYLEELLKSSDYPFSINISISNNGELEPKVGKCTVIISLVWPFEQGDDELDTLWGGLAYEYYSKPENEKTPSISIKMELKAVQVDD